MTNNSFSGTGADVPLGDLALSHDALAVLAELGLRTVGDVRATTPTVLANAGASMAVLTEIDSALKEPRIVRGRRESAAARSIEGPALLSLGTEKDNRGNRIIKGLAIVIGVVVLGGLCSRLASDGEENGNVANNHIDVSSLTKEDKYRIVRGCCSGVGGTWSPVGGDCMLPHESLAAAYEGCARPIFAGWRSQYNSH